MSVTNSPSVETYKAYAEALNARDIDRTRTYLHDDLTYQGPVGEIRTPPAKGAFHLSV
jgi:predicted ester cyclase